MDGNNNEKEGQSTKEPISTEEWVRKKFGEQKNSTQREGKETNSHGNAPNQNKDKTTGDEAQSINVKAEVQIPPRHGRSWQWKMGRRCLIQNPPTRR